ncbi:helix-turn-helix transcriptional regulator [Xanthobacter pseudotagetidis]|uniref:helix-turn-helix transcriptional regulator n=1 Tax=Xanthobacter pseudotagetidis TaxID=3119911 RepID=UPI00372C92BE
MTIQNAHPAFNGPELLRDTEAAAHLRISRTSVWRLHQKGAFPSVRIGGRTLFRRADLNAFIEKQVSGVAA